MDRIWMVPRAAMDAVMKEKEFPAPAGIRTPPIIQPEAKRYTTEISRLLRNNFTQF
jgi:hypothetical protein